jgi:hypothetical protein
MLGWLLSVLLSVRPPLKRYRRSMVEHTSSSSSLTAINDDTAGPISTRSGGFTAKPTVLSHSLISFPECDSLTRVPTRFREVYSSANLGRASVGGSLPFAWASISMGTTAPPSLI